MKIGMKNKLLTITRGMIPYIKELRPAAKSVASCILMQQLDYWFNKHPNGFYKFLEPSSGNENYLEGDSWVEELNFSAEEFKTAFSNIGIAYKSKTEFDQVSNKFFSQDKIEKFYCSYFDRQTKLTFYFRNHNLVDKLLAQLVSSPETDNAGLPETGNPGLLENSKLLPRNRQPRFTETDNLGLQKPATPVCFKRISEITTETTQESKEEEFVSHSLDTTSSLSTPLISVVPEEEPMQTSFVDLEVELSEPDIQKQIQPSVTTNTSEEKKPLNRQQALIGAFASLLKLNLLIYRGGAARLGKEIKLFSEHGITAEDVNKFSGYWYNEDFRGQKGEPPTLEQVSQKWDTAMEWCQPKPQTLVQQPQQPTAMSAPRYQPQMKLINNKAIQTQTMIDDVFDAIEGKI